MSSKVPNIKFAGRKSQEKRSNALREHSEDIPSSSHGGRKKTNVTDRQFSEERQYAKREFKLEKKLNKLRKQLSESRSEFSKLQDTLTKSKNEFYRQKMECLRHKKEKSNMEKKLRDVSFKVNVLKKKLIKSESERDKLSKNLAQASSPDAHFRDVLENSMQCSVCSEIFVNSMTITCGHTFCEECIEEWKRKKENCPICRADILYQVNNCLLDDYINKVFEIYFSESEKELRSSLRTQRFESKAKREARESDSDCLTPESSESGQDDDDLTEHWESSNTPPDDDDASRFSDNWERWDILSGSSSLSSSSTSSSPTSSSLSSLSSSSNLRF